MAARENEADLRPNFAPQGSITVTKSDSTVLSPICRYLYVGVTGDVALRLLDGSTPTFKAVPVGLFGPIQFDQVLSTGTAATNMVALW